MLNKLQIRRFRKNEKLDVVLEPITVFCGPSGSGKSSLVGALKWLTFNSPSGTDFIHWDHSSAIVRLIEGKNSITRKRGKTENYYKINKQKPYKAFGTGVPDKVSRLLNMSSLNFHRQHAGPFWFRETAGEVSRQLNSIVNLDLIDTTLSNLDKQHRQTKAEKSVIKQRIKEAKLRKKELRYILSFNKRLSVLERVAKEHENNATKLTALVNLRELAQQYQAEATQSIPKIGQLMKLCKGYKQLEKQHYQLTALFGHAEEYEEAIHQYSTNIKQKEKELKKLVGNACPWCGRKLK